MLSILNLLKLHEFLKQMLIIIRHQQFKYTYNLFNKYATVMNDQESDIPRGRAWLKRARVF